MPVGEKVGVGLSIISDQIGPINETNAYADFSYTLQLGGPHKIAFGIKAGATFHDRGLGDLDLIDPGDPFLIMLLALLQISVLVYFITLIIIISQFLYRTLLVRLNLMPMELSLVPK